MAYLKDLYRPLCGQVACSKDSVTELYNCRSTPVGYYCQPHGKQALQRLKAQETIEYTGKA